MILNVKIPFIPSNASWAADLPIKKLKGRSEMVPYKIVEGKSGMVDVEVEGKNILLRKFRLRF